MRRSTTRPVAFGLAAAAIVALATPGAHVAAVRDHAAPTWLAVQAKTHSVTLTLIAGYNDAIGGFNFDGYGRGKMVIYVPRGYRINVVFSNKAVYPHSAVFTPYALKDKEDGYPLAFKGAASPDPTNGVVLGKVQRFSFVASKAGAYALVCGVPGHEGAGMWDVLKVTNGGKAHLTTS